MKLTYIELPVQNLNNAYSNYENQLAPRCTFESEKLKAIFEEKKSIILCIVESEILKRGLLCS